MQVMRQVRHESERRQFGRRAVRLQGWVEVPGRPRISCFVSNISGTGARLELMDDFFLPYHFHISIPDEGMRRRCEVKYTAHRVVGVRYCQESIDSHLKSTDAEDWKG